MKNQINRMLVGIFAVIGLALFIAGCGQKHEDATCCMCPDGSCTTACCDNMNRSRGANNANTNNANMNSNANTNSNTNTNSNVNTSANNKKK